MKMREVAVKKQIQQVLLYVQGGSADVWKKNILEDLEAGLLEYETVGEFLTDIRKEFREGDKKSTKVAELMSSLKTMNFKFHFLLYFHSLFDLFSFSIFRTPGLGLE